MQKILVIDDDRDLRESLVEILANAGFEVSMATQANEGLAKLEKERFALVLLDLVMPGMSGMEALYRILEASPTTKIIMVTAFATIENAVAALRQGASDYLAKPFRSDELLSTVRRTLQEARFEVVDVPLDVDMILNCLANPIRRQILLSLEGRGPMRFMDICRHLEMEDHTKLNFHLKILREACVIDQEQRNYQITPQGRHVLSSLKHMMRSVVAP